MLFIVNSISFTMFFIKKQLNLIEFDNFLDAEEVSYEFIYYLN